MNPPTLARASGLDETLAPTCLLSYGKRMPTHGAAENAWRIRVDDEYGQPRGAGVLLDDRQVLTSTHVVEHAGASPGGPKNRVRSSVVCKPEWSIIAKVVPGSWLLPTETILGYLPQQVERYVVSVDRAADPHAVMPELLGPLARRTRSCGIRLVLGFDGRAPAGLPHEVSLGPEPVIGDFVEVATSAQARASVNKLAAAEDAAAGLDADEGFQFFGSPLLPRCRARQLRIRLAGRRRGRACVGQALRGRAQPACR